VAQVEDLMRRELTRICREGLQPDEMERARNTAIAEHEMNLQDTQGVAMTCALNELYGLGGSYVFTTRERFERLTAADAQQAAVSVLSTNRAAVSLVLPEGPTAATEGKP
jgi:predicted Zn-dependent peptidase